MMRAIATAVLLLSASTVCTASAPDGLLVDFKRPPSLGVRTVPAFTWIVPPCTSENAGADHHQEAYQIVVSTSRGQTVWDSKQTVGSNSTSVPYAGPALSAGAPYTWTVTTWTVPKAGGAPCKSGLSTPAEFVTALDSWDSGTKFISLNGSTFGYFRNEVDVPAGVVSATAFVTAVNQDPMLSAYKFYVNGDLVDLGPGRGEAPVYGGDGKFRSLPYMTLDLTGHMSKAGAVALAFEAMRAGGPSVMMQLHLHLSSGKTVTIGTDEKWMAFNGDAHRKPGPARHGHSAGTGFIEYIDARAEPVGWKHVGFRTTGSAWSAASAATPTTQQLEDLHSKMEPSMWTADIEVVSIRPAAHVLPLAAFIADFGHEFQGGLRLSVTDGKAGQHVHISCGEQLLPGGNVGSTWGWEFDWTLRDGEQVLEQHKYMECRFVRLEFAGTAPTKFTVSAWKTHYPYYEGDSHFTSSSAVLNAVYELSRYTLEGASLDTYTDSNTRERRPYEADGIIAASARLLVQRDVLWPRHSHAWVLNDPTWPVEWKQISPFLGWQDYMATGTPDLSLAFMDQMHDRTMLKFVDETGTLATDKMGRRK
eukprot:SAG11_NODE_1429_length_4936_cov_5.029539_3_plen_589_part_00